MTWGMKCRSANIATDELQKCKIRLHLFASDLDNIVITSLRVNLQTQEVKVSDESFVEVKCTDFDMLNVLHAILPKGKFGQPIGHLDNRHSENCTYVELFSTIWFEKAGCSRIPVRRIKCSNRRMLPGGDWHQEEALSNSVEIKIFKVWTMKCFASAG
jgi:hypothetical protein